MKNKIQRKNNLIKIKAIKHSLLSLPLMKNAKQLTALLDLEKIEENIFRGNNFQAPWGAVFGGQVLAQSLHAAYQTVPDDRFAHSMHAYSVSYTHLTLPTI